MGLRLWTDYVTVQATVPASEGPYSSVKEVTVPRGCHQDGMGPCPVLREVKAAVHGAQRQETEPFREILLPEEWRLFLARGHFQFCGSSHRSWLSWPWPATCTDGSVRSLPCTALLGRLCGSGVSPSMG